MESKQFDRSRRSLLKWAGATAVATAATPAFASASPAAAPVAKLFYTETGNGRNVMLLRGWACDSHDWSWQLPALESNYPVVAADLRGHGRSEVMSSGASPSCRFSPEMAKWVSEREAQSFSEA